MTPQVGCLSSFQAPSRRELSRFHAKVESQLPLPEETDIGGPDLMTWRLDRLVRYLILRESIAVCSGDFAAP